MTDAIIRAYDPSDVPVQVEGGPHISPRTRRIVVLLIEILVVVILTVWVYGPYIREDGTRMVAGRELEWLTSHLYQAAIGLRNEGYIPLWQPWLNYGEPLIDNPFSSVLNPLALLPTVVAGPVMGVRISVVLHALLAGLGGIYLGYILRMGLPARLLLAALLLAKGNMIAMIGDGYFQLGIAQAYFPWIIGGTIHTLRTKRLRTPVVLTAVMFTLMFFAGNIWYMLPMLMSMGLLAAFHTVSASAHPQRLRWVLGAGLAILIGTAILLALFYDGDLRPLVPVVLAAGVVFFYSGFSLRQNNWAGLKRVALIGVFTVGLSAVLLLPIFFNQDHIGAHPNEIEAGAVVDLWRAAEQFVVGNVESYYANDRIGEAEFYYSYVVPMWFLAVLLLIAPPMEPFLSFGRRALPQGWRIWAAGVTMIVLCTVWGAGGNPVVIWLYRNVPLLGQWRFVGRALAVASFWIAVLVALRVDYLWRLAADSAWRRLRVDPFSLRGVQRYLLVGLLALSALAVYQVLATNARWSIMASVGYADNQCLDWLREQDPTGQYVVYREGYEAIYTFLDHRVRLHDIEADFLALPEPYTIGTVDMTTALPDLGLAWTDNVRLFLAENGFSIRTDSLAMFDTYCWYDRPPTNLPYAFTIPVNTMEAATFIPTPDQATAITAFNRGLDRIGLYAQANPSEPTVVTVQELAYPGWFVWVDDQPAKLESVGGFVGVVLPPGEGTHKVFFAYRPPLLYVGGVITIVTAIIAGAYLLGVDRMRRRRSVPPATTITPIAGEEGV